MESQYSLTNEEIYDLVEIASKKYRSPIDRDILIPLLNMVYGALVQNNRILAIRSDLRFAQSHVLGEPDLPLCFQRDDAQAITRSFESLKSQYGQIITGLGDRVTQRCYLMGGVENVTQASIPIIT